MVQQQLKPICPHNEVILASSVVLVYPIIQIFLLHEHQNLGCVLVVVDEQILCHVVQILSLHDDDSMEPVVVIMDRLLSIQRLIG